MRIKNVMRNSFFSLLSQLVLILIGFISQRTLNLRLGEALVGLNGVISNLISILSVSELGIATAVVYNLYQALAGGDEETIAGLMNLYRRAYEVFAAAITVMGLALMPFLHLFLKDNPFTAGYVRLIYLLWLFRTVLSYLLSYKRSVLIADQKEYVVSIVTLVMNVLGYAAVIILVMTTENYALALGLNIVIDALCNLWLTRYVNQKYPFLRRLKKAPLSKKLRARVFSNIKNIFVVRLANKLLVATDNVIVSGFIGVAFAGLYGNYCLITNSLVNIAVALSNAIQPSVGAMFVEREEQRDAKMLRMVTFLFFLFAASAGSGVYAAAQPFVRDLWLGGDYLLELSVVGACVVNFFVLVISQPLGMVMGVTGLFELERNLAAVSGLCNMALSLGLVGKYGIFGVLAGTLAAYVLQIICRLYAFYHVYLHVSARSYLADLLQYFLLGFAEILAVWALSGYVYGSGGWLRFFLLVVFAGGAPLALNLLLYVRSERLRSILLLLRGSVQPGKRSFHASKSK